MKVDKRYNLICSKSFVFHLVSCFLLGLIFGRNVILQPAILFIPLVCLQQPLLNG